MPFKSVRDAQGQMDGLRVQAAATNMGRFTLREDFQQEIGDYMYRECPFWSRLNKRPTQMDIVKEIVSDSRPQGGFTDKLNLDPSTIQRNPNFNDRNLNDPGQQVKAYTNYLDWSHYTRSLAQMQSNPYGETVNRQTNLMIDESCQDIEMALINGDADANPLEFNGLRKQMSSAPDHVQTGDYTGANPVNVGQKIAESITRTTVQRTKRRKITDIYTSGCGFNLLQVEAENRRLTIQDMEYLPGLQVPSIITPHGRIPIIVSPHFDDTPPADGNPGQIHFWLLDMDMLEWRGVFPYNGQDNVYEPQIFEVTQHIGDQDYLTESRLALMYGTLFAYDQGDGIFRLDITAPDELIWSQTAAARP